MQVYIHVGYPKNASTTLQSDVFPNVKNALYLGRRYGGQSSYISDELSEAMYALSMFDSIEYAQEEVKAKIVSSIKAAEGDFDKIIISSEAFANNMSDRGVMAQRLKYIFPDAKILMLIRNQLDALRSMYSFLVKQRGLNINISYGRPSIRSFESWIAEQEAMPGRSFILTLKYYEFINVYMRLFGQDSVKVMLFEDLVKSPQSFYQKLGEFLGESLDQNMSRADAPKRNSGLTKRALAYYRFRAQFPNVAISNFVPSFITELWRGYINRNDGGKNNEYLPEDVERRLQNIYREGNALLIKELGLNISDHGYFT